MTKIRRNAPCTCGSGRKYKKCCLKKDEEKKLEARQAQKIKADKDKPEQKIQPIEVDPPGKTGEDFPGRTDQVNPLVDAWWDEYLKMDDVDDIRQHLENFFKEHPVLVHDLELYEEALFEIGAKYFRQDRHEEYIDLLTRIRKEFSDTYMEGFGYYDFDMISFKVMTDRKDEIPALLENFKAYPDKDPESLFKLIEYLMANNCQDIVSDFVQDIYYQVYTSPNIIGGDKILEAAIFSYLIPFLKPDFSDDDLETLSAQLKEIPQIGDYCRPESLKKEFHFIFGEFSKWNIKDCRKKKDTRRRYYEVSLNYMGFLNENKNKDWMAAEFFRKMIYAYLVRTMPERRKPKAPFRFVKEKIDQTTAKIAKYLFSLDTTRAVGTLNAIFWFAEYLEATETISETERKQTQEWCSELAENVFPKLLRQDFSAKTYQKCLMFET